jgi:hypothetical protein
MISYLPNYLGRYLHNKFLASLPRIALNCAFKIFLYFSYFCLCSKNIYIYIYIYIYISVSESFLQILDSGLVI